MPTNPMSIIAAYIKAYVIEDKYIKLNQVNTTIKPLEKFDEKVSRLKKEKHSYEEADEYNIFLIITTTQSRKNIEKYMAKDVKNIYEEFKKYKSIEEYLGDDCYVRYYCEKENEAIINSIVDLWLQREEPRIYGKQIITTPYLLKDLCGRMIIATFPNNETGTWNLLLEGGTKLSLNEEDGYFNKLITSDDVGRWTQGDINNIINNPCYLYGIYPEQIELFYEWHRAFIYQIAVLQINKIKEDILEELYIKFLDFIKKEVCECVECPALIEKNRRGKILKIQIQAMKSYIKAKEQSVIAKNELLNIGKRYAYMPAIKEIVNEYLKENNNQCKQYDKNKLEKIIKGLEQIDSYKKGIAMEKLAQYYLETIKRNTNNRN